MGEAKRRRSRIGQPIEYFDIHSNKTMTARNAGDPVEFIASFKATAAAQERGERPVANVPCDGCTACCYFSKVEFDPQAERAEDLAHLDFVEEVDNKVRLRKREDGACIHLGEKGCTVYEHRPRPCRFYDCRVAALVGMVDTFDGDRHSPFWIFDPHTPKSRAFQEAFRTLGMLHRHRASESGESRTTSATLKFAFEHVDKFASAIEELLKLPPEQAVKALGFDPGKMTKEEHVTH